MRPAGNTIDDGGGSRRHARLLTALALYTVAAVLVVLAGLIWVVREPVPGIVPVVMLVGGSAGAAAGTAMIAVLRRSRAG